MKKFFKKMGEVKAIEEFYRIADKKNISVKRFRMDRAGDSILITATDYYCHK